MEDAIWISTCHTSYITQRRGRVEIGTFVEENQINGVWLQVCIWQYVIPNSLPFPSSSRRRHRRHRHNADERERERERKDTENSLFHPASDHAPHEKDITSQINHTSHALFPPEERISIVLPKPSTVQSPVGPTARQPNQVHIENKNKSPPETGVQTGFKFSAHLGDQKRGRGRGQTQRISKTNRNEAPPRVRIIYLVHAWQRPNLRPRNTSLTHSPRYPFQSQHHHPTSRLSWASGSLGLGVLWSHLDGSYFSFQILRTRFGQSCPTEWSLDTRPRIFAEKHQ